MRPQLNAGTLSRRNMRTVEVAEISIDEAGRLLIRPTHADPLFQYVYRAAAEVSWDSVQSCFTCPKPRERLYVEWFQHARDVVRSELGCNLELNSQTAWTNIPEGLRAEILSGRIAG
jgi:Integron Cassette Protein Hfx_Cass5